jgi:hypothetical protein
MLGGVEQEWLVRRSLLPLAGNQEEIAASCNRLPQRQQRLKDARLPAIIRADEDSNWRGLNRGVLVELEVFEADRL